MRKRNVGIFIFDDVEVLDFAGPFEVFSRTRLAPGLEALRSDAAAPFHVFTIARDGGPVLATGGLKIIPEFAFNHHPIIDLLVVPGGFGTRPLMNDLTTLEWIQSVAQSTELTTSVCTGALLLANAGLLRDRESTTHWAALDLLASLAQDGSASSGMRVDRTRRVVDTGAGVITSAGVASGIDMSFYVIEKLLGKDVADQTAKYIEYRRVPA